MITPLCLKKYLRFTTLCSLILSLPLPGLANTETIYSVGVVPQFEARRITEIWQPILAEVSQLSGVKLELKGLSQYSCVRTAVYRRRIRFCLHESLSRHHR